MQPVKRRRILVLIVLAVGTLLYRGTDAYVMLFHPSIALSLGFDLMSEGGELVIGDVRAKDVLGRTTPAAAAGLLRGDRVRCVFDPGGRAMPLSSYTDVGLALRRISYGQSWTMTIQRPGTAGEQLVKIPAVTPPQSASRLYRVALFQHFLGPLIGIFTAFLLGFKCTDDDHAFVGSLMFLSFSVIFGVQMMAFPPALMKLAFIYALLGECFAAYLFMRFFLYFPCPSPIARRAPWLDRIFLWVSVLQFGAALLLVYPSLISFDLHRRICGWADPYMTAMSSVLFAVAAGMLLTGVVSLLLNTVGADSKDDRRRGVLLLTGALLGIGPIFLLFAYHWLIPGRQIGLIALLIVSASLMLFPLSFVYVVVKHRVFGIRVILRRGLQYALVSRGFAVVEALLLFLLLYFAASRMFVAVYPDAGPVAISAGTVMLTLAAISGLRKVNRPVLRSIDRRFFREAYNAQEILTQLGRAVRKLAGHPESMIDLVVEKIQESLHPEHVALFLRRNGDGLQCARMLRRREGVAAVVEDQPLSIPSTAFLPRHLAELREPEVIELYPQRHRPTTTALVPRDGVLAIERDLIERLNTRIVIPLISAEGLLGFLSLGEKLSEEPYTREDKSMLLSVAEQTSIALDYSVLVRQVADQEKLRREVEIAKEVQSRLFPQSLPLARSLDYACICKAARGVAGDYYDILPVGPDRLGIAVGDVSGKGIGAALLMAGLQALLRSQALIRPDSVDQLMSDINGHMCRSTDDNKYATFFYGIYDDATRKLTYVNAGHNPPIVLRPAALPDAHAELRPLPAKANGGWEMFRLEQGGMAVGMFDTATYEQETVHLQRGDLLLLFTDGVTEAQGAQGEEFGEERLVQVATSLRGGTAQQICDRILEEVTTFVSDAPLYDDITLVVARVL